MSSAACPDCGSVPIIAIMMPRQPAASPRSGALPDRMATIDMPKTANANSSGDPRNSITGRRIGIETASRQAPNTPPIIDDMYDGTERAPGFALLRHRESVKHGCRRGCTSWHAEQHRRDGIAGRGGRAQAEQQRERRVGVHVEGERQQHRRPGEAADTRHDSEHQAHQAAGRQIHQAVRIHQDKERLARGGRHKGNFVRYRFHVFSPQPNSDHLQVTHFTLIAREEARASFVPVAVQAFDPRSTSRDASCLCGRDQAFKTAIASMSSRPYSLPTQSPRTSPRRQSVLANPCFEGM